MTSQDSGGESIDYSINGKALYREEIFTDLNAGSIRRMVPVTETGEQDTARAPIFVGSLQIMTPQGPIPIQSRLPANNLTEAVAAFAETMQAAVATLMEEVEKMAKEQQQKEASRIIVPGRE